MRVLGIAQDSGGKWGSLYAALAQHVEVVDVIRPTAPRSVQVRSGLRNWRLNLQARTLDPLWSALMFDARTRSAGEQLPAGGYDLIVQAQMLCGPGTHPPRPYVVYTDSTHALNQRHRFGGDPTPGRRGDELRARERGVAHGAAHVFTMSEFARGSLMADYGVDGDRITVVGAGVNVEVAPDPYPRDRPRAILVGIELERKGGLEVLAAWPRVRAAVPDAELVIVGPRERREAEGVRFYGRTPLAEVSRLYGSATVFVCPTLWDPWGLVYHEAMAHGLPCIGTDRFAVPEIIEDGVTGLLVPPRDPDAVAEALIALLSDPERARRMGEEGRRRVAAEATWDAVAARMLPQLELSVRR